MRFLHRCVWTTEGSLLARENPAFLPVVSCYSTDQWWLQCAKVSRDVPAKAEKKTQSNAKMDIINARLKMHKVLFAGVLWWGKYFYFAHRAERRTVLSHPLKQTKGFLQEGDLTCALGVTRVRIVCMDFNRFWLNTATVVQQCSCLFPLVLTGCP